MPEPFRVLTGAAVPLLRDNIDTDTISPGSSSPSQASGRTFSERGSTTLADDLFANWRYGPDGSPEPDFPLNQPRYKGARILLTGANFGCGSSRESAVWMLAAWGIRCIIAPSFSDIFANNCYANGMLPLTLGAAEIAELASEAESGVTAPRLTIDLEACRLDTTGGRSLPFAVSAYRRKGLMTGLDEIALTLDRQALLDGFVTSGRATSPWLYPG